MIEAGVRELKDHLSEYLRRVQRGERVVITARGRPVAALVALEQERGSEVGRSLVRQSVADWGGGKPQGLPDPPTIPGRRAEEIVIEDRR